MKTYLLMPTTVECWISPKLTKSADVEAVVIEKPEVSPVDFVLTDRVEHHKQQDWHRTEVSHCQPTSVDHIRQHHHLKDIHVSSIRCRYKGN